MKLQESKEDQVLSIECRGVGRGVPTAPVLMRRTLRGAVGTPRPTSVTRHSSGVALVITLILLSVITFMAITFLVVSRGEKSTVGSVTEQTTARLAAETGLEMANDAIIAPMLAFTNPSTVHFLVSTNYLNPLAFNTAGALRAYLTNVNFTYPNGTPLNAGDNMQNIANLFYLPRVPVYVTNRLLGSNEFVYYLDLNRNGRFEPSGNIVWTNNLGQPISNGTNGFVTNFVMGDPQWIGILERGNYTPGLYNLRAGRAAFPVGMPHSADNQFISRYAYVVIPAGAALDINYMHNYAKVNSINMAADGFWRNQGVGTWEINLAAFLADLNTNYWNNPAAPYIYDKSYPAVQANKGTAFDDAVALLRYRYANTWRPPPNGNGKLLDVQQNFGPVGAALFRSDFVDMYSSGETTGPWWTPVTAPLDGDAPKITTVGWWGSDNPSNFFDMQDLFDRTKSVPANLGAGQLQFCDRLQQAGTNTDSYDRYTFYRLLQQLGTESGPEKPKMNLNFANVDANGNIVPNMATNLNPWDAAQFFTNAAARMLADAGYGTNIVDFAGGIPRVHIQVYPNNYYTPSVHRYLQLAANIYDANVNLRTNINMTGLTNGNGFPSVFRPLYVDEFGAKSGSNRVWIVGYREVGELTNAADQLLISTNTLVPFPPNPARFFHDLDDPLDRPVKPQDMVYGVPLIIGAKKGFPNFNEFAMQSDISATRKLTFHRPNVSSQPTSTNQIFNFGVTNMMAIEAWNSYSTAYARSLRVVGVADVVHVVTALNKAGQTNIVQALNGVLLTNVFSVPFLGDLNSGWPGMGVSSTPFQRSFLVPVATNYLSLTNSTYLSDTIPPRFAISGKDLSGQFPIPKLWIKLKPRIRFALVDKAANRIVDYVNISASQDPIDVADLLGRPNPGQDGQRCDQPVTGLAETEMLASMFCTNRQGSFQNPALNYGPGSIFIPTYGIIRQIAVSGNFGEDVTPTIWQNYAGANTIPNQKQSEQQKFKDRMLGNASSGDTQLDFDAPFVPHRTIHERVPLQANDPLVHYTVADMTDPFAGRHNVSMDTDNDNPPLPNIGGMSLANNRPIGSLKPANDHYRPWGGNPYKPGIDTTSPTIYNLAVRDPQVVRSDNWDFPTNRLPNVGWLGRVHRGTPWQTLYLKAPITDLTTWTNWSGHTAYFVNYDDRGSSNYDGFFSMPTNDFRVMDLFTTAINENASKGQLSVNQTNLPAWSAVLSGVIVNTNGSGTNGFTWIEPAGSGYDPLSPPALVRIVNGINRIRSNPTNFPSGVFTHRGDILGVPELTTASPYLSLIPTNFTQGTASQAPPDWVYERIPQQIMGLLRADDQPRFVVYAFGQSLKPAEHSLVTASGSFFGLCTNYQVTAESVIRAVVRVDNAPSASAPNNIPRVVVESFNVLGPY